MKKNSSLTLQVMWLGFKRENVYFHRKAREEGESRWTLGKKIKLVVDSMMSFSYAPVRMMSTVGGLFFCASIIWAIVIIVQTLVHGADVAGWASLMALVLCSSGLIMLMLGMLGEYIWRTLDETRKRPPFLVDETRGFEETKGESNS